jgi:hypothetical protein
MAHWRGLVTLTACGLALAACGSDAGMPTTTTSALTPIMFILTVDESGNLLRLGLGDEVVPRLPLTGYDDEGWVMTVPPNPAVLGGGDDMRFFPSEVDQGVAYHEFSFIAVGPGSTSVTLTHGFQQFAFTVQVADRG